MEGIYPDTVFMSLKRKPRDFDAASPPSTPEINLEASDSRAQAGLPIKVRLADATKWMVFPGVDMGTRLRAIVLPRFFQRGPVRTLDAGCGNGAIAYAAYRRGNEVLAVSLDETTIAKNKRLFNRPHIDPKKLRFEVLNLYDLPSLGMQFDQIVCSETLEHITDHQKILRCFRDLLRKGGELHLCCPYRLHPLHHLGRVNGPEDGGHVRDGYTLEDYRELLEPLGFKIEISRGLQGPISVFLDNLVRSLRGRIGTVCVVPFAVTVWALMRVLSPFESQMPFSLYVLATKK